MCRVVIPAALRQFTDGAGHVDVEHPDGAPLAEVLDALGSALPALIRRIRDERGEVRRFVNVYVDGEDAGRLNGLQTAVPTSAEVLILPSVAGG
jgi:sulfur-carrier protein